MGWVKRELQRIWSEEYEERYKELEGVGVTGESRMRAKDFQRSERER